MKKKILWINLELNFTRNTLGCYGLNLAIHYRKRLKVNKIMIKKNGVGGTGSVGYFFSCSESRWTAGWQRVPRGWQPMLPQDEQRALFKKSENAMLWHSTHQSGRWCWQVIARLIFPGLRDFPTTADGEREGGGKPFWKQVSPLHSYSTCKSLSS